MRPVKQFYKTVNRINFQMSCNIDAKTHSDKWKSGGGGISSPVITNIHSYKMKEKLLSV